MFAKVDFLYVADLARSAREQFAKAGFSDSVNPYPPRSRQYWAWEWGWRNGRQSAENVSERDA